LASLHTAALTALLFLTSCAAHRAPGSFQVVRAAPEYLLRSPDAQETPFPDILNPYRDARTGWVDLIPQMELRLENAYYREGSLKHDLASYLGTQSARFQVRPHGGLRLVSAKSPVQELVSPPRRRYSHSRFFFTVAMNRKSPTRTAVLLGANSAKEIYRLTAQLLSDPESVCGDKQTHCTTFPETCTASIEIEITVNGAIQSVVWGTGLDRIAARPRRIEMLRLDRGRPVPVKIDATDPAALRLPLLPGDRIDWE
jgi:hypothetical protein